MRPPEAIRASSQWLSHRSHFMLSVTPNIVYLAGHAAHVVPALHGFVSVIGGCGLQMRSLYPIKVLQKTTRSLQLLTAA